MKIDKFRLLSGDIEGLAIPSVETLPTSFEENLLVVHQGKLKRASVENQDWNTIPVQDLGLFAFSSHTFTNAGAVGRYGPSLASCRARYNSTEALGWKNNNELFNVVGGIQIWTVPKTGTFRIEVTGACGGQATETPGFYGKGAMVIGEFDLTAGDKLRICVGQRGADTTGSGAGAPGGGASFVHKIGDSLPLVVAGGGSGAADYLNLAADLHDAYATPIAGPSHIASGRATAGGPGGSWFGSAYNSSFQNAGHALSGSAIGGNGDHVGGFGGGGGHYTLNNYAGGGGGYSGGSEHGGREAYQGIPQSGSYNSGAKQRNWRGVGNGHGIVYIEFIE